MFFYENDKFVNKNWKGVISGKIKRKACFADKDLSSWTGLGKSGLALAGLDMSEVRLCWVQFRTFRVQK